MADDFQSILDVSKSGLTAQSKRMRIIAENLANANTTPSAPGLAPYQRKVVTFRNVFDKTQQAYKVQTGRVVHDKSAFGKRFDPGNPSADNNGYVQVPNVQPLIEIMDMRNAQRSYEANLTVIDASRTMMSRTMELLK